MPKDEFDFEDPLELNGVAFLTEEDTSAEMAECFAYASGASQGKPK